jgi:hypothetical protein
MYLNAGEKGRPHRDPDDPPRRRANRFNGHGTFDNDRPPILGVIGRESGQVFLRQTYRSTAKAIEPVVLRVTAPGTEVHTDEWRCLRRPRRPRPNAVLGEPQAP